MSHGALPTDPQSPKFAPGLEAGDLEPRHSQGRHLFLGHPVGLFLLFFVEMWERFSYYGMRGILVLYLTSPTGGMRVLPPGRHEGFNPGRGWTDHDGNTAYGWYTGLCYLTPIVGGMIADKLIGTHRSMVAGGLLIALGHIMLGVSGYGAMDQSALGMSIFVFGLALIIIGTGHFKPCVSVMVGQLYALRDPRRETAFGIFYMGINLGAAIQTYIVGTLGERVGWHWGFGAAAVGMLLGLAVYMGVRPLVLKGVGLPANPAKGRIAPLLIPVGVVLAGAAAFAFHAGVLGRLDEFFSRTWVVAGLGTAATAWALYFIFTQPREDRGPVASIFIFMLFNAVFWLAFEQAGSSINLFTDRDTDRTINLGEAVHRFGAEPGYPVHWGVWIGLGAIILGAMLWTMIGAVRRGAVTRQFWSLIGILAGAAVLILGILKPLGYLDWLGAFSMVPTTWFQSVNPWLIIIFAPLTGLMWTALARRHKNPSQPTKIGIGLVLVGLGYFFILAGAIGVAKGTRAPMFYIVATYFVHTMGELALSPTGLSYVTKAAPPRYVSLLMGIWFISSFIANLAAGKVAAWVEPILQGKKSLPWHLASAPTEPNTQADFFFLFVVTSCGAGVLILILVPLLKKLMRNPED